MRDKDGRLDRRPRDYYEPDLDLGGYELPRRSVPTTRPAVGWQFLLGLALAVPMMVLIWALVIAFAWLLID